MGPLARIRPLLATLWRRLGATTGNGPDGSEESDGEGSGGPFAGSRLDRSVNVAHGQQADVGQREIERVQRDAADLERADDESGPGRP